MAEGVALGLQAEQRGARVQQLGARFGVSGQGAVLCLLEDPDRGFEDLLVCAEEGCEAVCEFCACGEEGLREREHGGG